MPKRTKKDDWTIESWVAHTRELHAEDRALYEKSEQCAYDEARIDRMLDCPWFQSDDL